MEHVHGLLALYGAGMTRLPGSPPHIVMQTMFEPIPKPSFDTDGKEHYRTWLEKRYAGDIETLNQRYGLTLKSFSALTPSEYWLRPEELNRVDCARPTAQDFAQRTPDFHRWIDNQTYLADEMEEYHATTKRQWRALEP